MKHEIKVWKQKLKKHAVNCRASRPIPERDVLSWPQMMQLHIIKGSLLSSIKKFLSSISPGPGSKAELSACLVFTSSLPGLVAAQEIAQGKKLPLVFLYPQELSRFLHSFPDIEYKYHIHTWSHFLEKLDSESYKIAAGCSLNENETYWLHIEGLMLGPQCGRGVENLWSWNGSQTKLLKKSFRHWAS